MLYHNAHDDEAEKVIQACNYLSSVLPQTVTYHSYRANSSDGLAEHRDSQSIFATAVITLEEREGHLQTDTNQTYQNRGPRDIQFLAPNVLHSVPRVHRTYDRKTIIFAL